MFRIKVLIALSAVSFCAGFAQAQEPTADAVRSPSIDGVAKPLAAVEANHDPGTDFRLSADQIAADHVREILDAQDNERRKQLQDVLGHIGEEPPREIAGLKLPRLVESPRLEMPMPPGRGFDHQGEAFRYKLQNDRYIDQLVDKLPRYLGRIDGKIGGMKARLDYGLPRRCRLKGVGLCFHMEIP